MSICLRESTATPPEGFSALVFRPLLPHLVETRRDAMSKSLFDQLMSEPERLRDRPTRPPLPLVGVMVRWERQLRQWKVATLASFSSVSVSTVERVERGEPVSDD